MLSPYFSTMSEEEFTSLPTSTNAVESHNRLSKHNKAEILCVALLTTYKIDMAAAIGHMARSEELPTSYTASNDVQRKKNSSAVRKSHLKRKLEREGDNDGPPDKQTHLESDIY